MKFILSIDTEADNQWSHGIPITTQNVAYLPPFQALCERYNVIPTYLVTSDIVEDPRAVQYFQPLLEANKIEVGAHLHPWTTPPYIDQPGLRYNDELHAFPSELPRDLLDAKIEHLTHQIESAFGRRPLSFRAGRFGFNTLCAELLQDHGYSIDSSITPLVSWKKSTGIHGPGPDFTAYSAAPFTLVDKMGARLLELPVTILFTEEYLQNNPALQKLYPLAGKILRRIPIQSSRFHLSQPAWMRPFPGITAQDLVRVWDCAGRNGLDYVVMMFHSSELMPGASIYRPDPESVKNLLQVLETFFIFIKNQNAESIPLSSAAVELMGALHNPGTNLPVA